MLTAEVLVVGDMVEPPNYLAVVVGLLNGYVRHEAVQGGAVPVLFVRLDVDDIARTDLAHLAAAPGDVPDAVGHVESLSECMRVPRVASTRCEADHVDAQVLSGLAAGEPVDEHLAYESVGCSF